MLFYKVCEGGLRWLAGGILSFNAHRSSERVFKTGEQRYKGKGGKQNVSCVDLLFRSNTQQLQQRAPLDTRLGVARAAALQLTSTSMLRLSWLVVAAGVFA